MAYWQWTPSLSVGIEEIDNQHRKIIDYINLLDDAVHEKNQDKTAQALNGLVNYTLTHFAFEEQLMQEKNYSLSEAHKQVHESFTTRIRNYQERFLKGEDISRKLMSELRIWLTNHIKKDDQDYAPFVKQEHDQSWWDKTLKNFFG